jgi:predicted alpha/beta-fold hydrolase
MNFSVSQSSFNYLERECNGEMAVATTNEERETRDVPSVSERLPIRTEPFVARKALRGGHAQTLAAWATPRRIALPPSDDRIFSVAPDAQVICRCHWQAAEEPRLALILVHGLEGSSESQYIVGTAKKALEAGFHVVRMNMRNCGGSERLSRTLYHSGLSADVAGVAAAIAQAEPRRVARLAIAGFSMGANLVLKAAGEWGAAPPANIAAVAGVSAAMDLGPSADALHAPANRIYEWNFMRALRRSIRRKAQLFPDLYGGAKLAGVHTIREFDDCITAPYCGFTDANDYYRRSSASRVVEHISVPALVIYAQDDPFIRVLPETEQKLRANPTVTLLTPEHGGHCAFLAARNGYDGRWAERQLVNFFRRFV